MRLKERLERLKEMPPEQRMRFIILLIVGSLAVFTVGFFGSIKFTSRPAFCGSCHEMEAESVTWSISSHNKVSCIQCHIEPGIGNFVKDKVGALGQVYLHVTRQVPDKIEMKKKIPNDVCLTCHNPFRQVTASGDIKIPHQKHVLDIKATPYCVDCHFNVTHAGIARREEAHQSHQKLQDLSNLKPGEFRPEMATCIGCHTKNNVTVTCNACHREIKNPDSHRQPDWKVTHGQQALKDWNQCLFCHDIIAKGQAPSAQERPLLEAVRGNPFCSKCHANKPSAHNETWVLTHKNQARLDKTQCYVCHDDAAHKPGVSSTASVTASAPPTAKPVVSCDKCHGRVHVENWIKLHPSTVKRDGTSSCFQCHQAPSCQGCHTQRGVEKS